jgi:hypothetical protein
MWSSFGPHLAKNVHQATERSYSVSGPVADFIERGHSPSRCTMEEAHRLEELEISESYGN